jgi:hypothetical protein
VKRHPSDPRRINAQLRFLADLQHASPAPDRKARLQAAVVMSIRMASAAG